MVRTVALAVAASAVSCDRPTTEPATSTPSAERVATAETIESSGRVLGVAIGSQLEEARAKLDPLREPGQYPPDEKELAGKRIYWKLAGTEYDWIMVWANSKGEVTRLRATPRRDRPKPFTEIGDLGRATVNTPAKVMWNVSRPEQPAFRLVADGKDHHALTLHMFALTLEMR